MQCKILLASVFLFPTLAANNSSVSPKVLTENISLQFKKPAAAFWELGNKKDLATNTTSLKQSNWYSDAMKNIAASEYQFKWEEKLNAYCTPNRKNNLRFFYNDKGFTVEPRTTKISIGEFDPMVKPDEINYKSIPNWKIKFNLDKKQVGKGLWKVSGNNAEYITDKITVHYINNEEGMRQNFIVHAPLSKSNMLKLNLNIKTKLKNKLNGNQLQFFHKKTNVLNYEDLKVWDAAGKSLTASFKKSSKGKYCIQVNTKEAIYPITIDPINTTPAAMVESNQIGAQMGRSVASAGDVNGDGYSDVIVGAYFYDNGQNDEGAAFVYHGSASGISTTAAAMVESNQASAYMGISVASAGDVNGDGYSDVIVGAYLYDNGQTDEGAAFVYHGSASGISTAAAARVESNQVSAYMGWSVASAGDVNGDGYSDVIVGAYFYDNGQNDEGAAFVYHGSATGINTTAAATVESNQINAQMGNSVASAGDVNGDGYSDVIVGARKYDNGQIDEGAAFVYHGSATGINTTAAAIVECNQANAQMGISVASAGDVNGDGYSDVIVGANGYANGQAAEGAAFVYHGSATGINTTAAATVESNQINAQMGNSVASAGDVNGDGYSDVIVGAYNYDNGQIDEGAAFVYHGSATGINTTAAAIVESNQINAQMGISVASAGDVNGDGYSDVIVGAYLYDNGQTDEGAAFVYHGSATGINTTTAATVESNQASAQMGYSVASAGDVNGDGYSDVIVGAYNYTNGQGSEGAFFVYHGSATGINTTAAAMVESNILGAYMGWSVASAGDVNGDGYSDVIVGVPSYTNGQTNEGAAFVYHGSATGINTIAAAMVESNQANASMGNSVASAGDVNGDGYSDVIVGAPVYDNGQTDEGVAFVYHGSATGINTTAAATVESNQASAQMGVSVASAGDVNGDGYSDVIVGANGYDNGQTNEGAAFVYHGSASGISTTAAAMVESNQVSANMGYSVASAGDVNGDGYSDVIVGAYWYDNGQTDEGAAFVYHGSPTGINTTAAAFVESNQVNAFMGSSVASAGDVNGDGYSDVIVGAFNYDNGQTDEGAAFVYHGSASGISTTAAAMVESNQASAWMGYSVASAGDVNGDGYSDVIVGAHQYDNGQTDEGAAFVFMGNSPGSNKRNNLRLYNTDLVTPIQHLNVTQPNLFGAGLFAKSPLGKVKGRLVWEVKKQGDAFSGNPITNSTGYLGKQPSFTDLGIAGTELKYNVQKVGKTNKIRTRVEYDKVTAITGQVYGPWRYPAGYTMGAYGMNSIPLPITLISFNGQFINTDDVRLNWITSNEINMQAYFVELSTDGIKFSPVGELPSKGIGNNRTDYSFTDKNVKHNLLYYRLKLKEKSGEESYTKTITLSRNKIVRSYIAPNPVRAGEDAVLYIQSSVNNTNVAINIYNGQGQLVFTVNKRLQNGINKIPLSTKGLANGIYVVNVLGDGMKESYRLVVQ